MTAPYSKNMLKVFEAQAIFEAFAADARARVFGEGMSTNAAETLAERGWRLLEELPEQYEDDDEEVKAPEPDVPGA